MFGWSVPKVRLSEKENRGNWSQTICTRVEENSPSFCIKDQTTWAVIINFERVKGTEDDASRKPEDADYTVDVLTRCTVSRDRVLKKR